MIAWTMHRYIEPLFDLALAVALWFMLPTFVRQFSTPDIYNGMILSAGYLALLLGTLFLRQVEASPSWLELVKQPTKPYSGCAFLLLTGLGGVYWQAIHTCQLLPVSFAEAATGPCDNLTAFLVLFLELQYFLLPWAYIIIALHTPRQRYLASTAQGIGLRIFGMAGVNLGALILFAGFIAKQQIDMENLFGPANTPFEWSWRMVLYVIAMSVFAALIWLPTRLIIQAYNPRRLAWVTFTITATLAGYLIAGL
jgi:hypothetical protein